MHASEAAQHAKVFLVPPHTEDENLAIVGAASDKVAVAHVSCREDPRVVSMQALKRVDRLLLVHDPKIDSVVCTRPSDKELSANHVQSVY